LPYRLAFCYADGMPKDCRRELSDQGLTRATAPSQIMRNVECNIRAEGETLRKPGVAGDFFTAKAWQRCPLADTFTSPLSLERKLFIGP
jgi:hypothetical protein